MDTVLLRAWRFLVDFQYRWVLKQPADTLDRGPARLAPLFDRIPALFPLMAAAGCRVSARPPGSAGRLWLGHRSPRVEADLHRLGRELGLELVATAPPRRRVWRTGLVSPALTLRIARTVGHRARRLDRHVQRALVEMLLEYAALRRLFARRPPGLVLVPCDLSPRRIAAGAAAEREGVPCLYLQLSLFNTYLPPFRPSRALIVNMAAERTLAAAGIPTVRRVLRREVPELRLPDDRPRSIGIVLNYYLDPERLGPTLAAVRRHFPEARIRLRRHPRSRRDPERLPAGVETDPPERPLAEFAAGIAFALAGNSVAQLDLLGLGVPVVHLDGLDALAFDHCGFVAEDLVFGVRRVEEIELDRLRAFYTRPEWRPRLLVRLGLFPEDGRDAAEWRAFRRWLQHRLDGGSSARPAPCAAS